ncbi:arsenate reductase (glutaredoxin) [bacterium]|nr:arsenate reductase (glutaredoxin) [bacterium]
MSFTIYHNPRCTKSRQTLELLEKKGIKPIVVEYLKTPPTALELDKILKALKLNPQDIIRIKEDRYQELKLKDKKLSRDEWINILIDNPVLIERPIVVIGNKAVIGRPPENILPLL